MKKNLKCLVWFSVPVLLAVGCAENHRDQSVSVSPALTESYTPTSDTTAARVYPGSGPDVTGAPSGANSQDWALAEEIRGLLTSDRKLGDAPMAAVVHNGVVTLRGDVRSDRERQQLRDEIARLPGVQRVDDQMQFRNPLGLGAGESKSY